MSLPAVGSLYKQGKVNGIVVWKQPGGVGTAVFPQFPSQNPVTVNGFPSAPMAYNGLYVWGCGHWSNTLETFQQYDPAKQKQALLLCCPMCSYVQAIVEPATDWYDKFFGLFNVGLGTGAFN